MAYNPKQPRDWRGRWTSGGGFTYRQNTGYNEILSKMVTLPLNFFEDLSKQGISQLEKGIRSKIKIIQRHELKIANPRDVYPNWDSFSDERKAREIHHWQKEIDTHKKEISEREALIRSKKAR